MKSDNAVILDETIKRGDSEITSVELRKPVSGELRGLNLADLLQMDVSALHKVLPRITMPPLTEHEVAGMAPADLMQMGAKVAAFLLPKAARQAGFPQP